MSEEKEVFQLGKENYKWLIIALSIVLVGLLLMAGGKPDTPEVFNEAVYSHRRITIAPLICLAGYLLVIYAILKKTPEPPKA